MIRRCVVVLLLLSGCSFFSRTKNDIYSLDVLRGAAVSSAHHGTPVGIESLELPPGFDRREIVVRKADHLLDVRSNELWSADLQPLVLHTLASDLASRLPEGMLILPGETKPANMRPIDIVFTDLSAGPDAKINVDAQWKLDNVTHHETFAIDIPSTDSKNIATGMSQALAQLAVKLGSGLENQLNEPR